MDLIRVRETLIDMCTVNKMGYNLNIFYLYVQS